MRSCHPKHPLSRLAAGLSSAQGIVVDDLRDDSDTPTDLAPFKHRFGLSVDSRQLGRIGASPDGFGSAGAPLGGEPSTDDDCAWAAAHSRNQPSIDCGPDVQRWRHAQEAGMNKRRDPRAPRPNQPRSSL